VKRRPAGAEYTRRGFLGIALRATAVAALEPGLARAQPLQKNKTRLILLGTGGGPRPRKNVCASSQVLIVNNLAYVVDCGDGVATQLVRADVPLSTSRHVFITHHHSDHNADYGNLLLLAWAAGLHTRVDTWGPPPIARMTDLFFEMSAPDIDARINDEGRIPLRPLIHVHEFSESCRVTQDENVTVTCALVDHPPMEHAFAYRFDAPDRSIVISGDTRRSEALIKLADGADVLVHEAMYPAAIERMASNVSNASRLKQSIIGHHTSAEDAGRVAQAAGVKTLVLSHLVPADDPEVTDEMWMEAAHRTFTGHIVVGKDLMEI
jgi:ribonuclease BN (tRNA processing enzyme)